MLKQKEKGSMHVMCTCQKGILKGLRNGKWEIEMYSFLLLLLLLRVDLPFWPAGRLDHRRHALLEHVLGLAEVDHVEDDPLFALDVFHGKVEPEANTWVARVRSD